jgi:hypothetical protein
LSAFCSVRLDTFALRAHVRLAISMRNPSACTVALDAASSIATANTSRAE